MQLLFKWERGGESEREKETKQVSKIYRMHEVGYAMDKNKAQKENPKSVQF